MLKLYKFYCDAGRAGSLRGIFTADDADVKRLIGRSVNFGEVLGKHSEVVVEIEEKELTVVTDDQEFIARFDELGCSSGFNPFDRADLEDDDDDEEEET